MKKFFVITALLLLPCLANASQQVVLGGGIGLTSGVANQFNFIGNISLGYTASAQGQGTRPKMVGSGTVSSMYVRLSDAPGGSASYQIKLFKNLVDTGINCTITGAATTCSDITNTSSYVQGDAYDVGYLPTGGPAATVPTVSVILTPTVNGDVFEGFNHGTFSATNNTYNAFLGIISASVVADTNITRSLFPEGGTVDTLQWSFQNAPGGTASNQLFLRNNAATTTLTCKVTGAALSCNDLVNSFSVASGDSAGISEAPLGPPVATGQGGVSFRYRTSTLGDFAFFSSGGTSDIVNTGTYFVSVGGGVSSTTESRVQTVSNAMIVKGFQVLLTVAPGAAASGKSRAYTFRVNGQDSGMSCTILETATTCTAAGSAKVSAGDLIDIKVIPTNTPTTGSSHISTLASTPVQSVKSKTNIFRGFVRMVGGFLRIR